MYLSVKRTNPPSPCWRDSGSGQEYFLRLLISAAPYFISLSMNVGMEELIGLDFGLRAAAHLGRLHAHLQHCCPTSKLQVSKARYAYSCCGSRHPEPRLLGDSPGWRNIPGLEE
jgi:hypothetical protein